VDEINSLVSLWLRTLRARNLSSATIGTYRASAGQLTAALHDAGVFEVSAIGRRHVEDFIAHLVETRSAATASVRFRALQQFFAWLIDEEEIAASPMMRMKPPTVPEHPVPVLSFDQVKVLIKACEGPTFVQRRDMAIIRLFLDTGMRLAELTNLNAADLDLDDDLALVLGKGRRPRACPFGNKTALALGRYLRLRTKHARATDPALWLAEKNRPPMTHNGIAQVIRRRGEQAGIVGLHPHQLRHTAAHDWLAGGGNEGDAMRLFGWKSRQMLSRYAASRSETEYDRRVAARSVVDHPWAGLDPATATAVQGPAIRGVL